MPVNEGSAFLFKEKPWQKEGVKLERPLEDSKSAIVAAGLDWRVKKADLLTDNGEKVQGHFAITREDNNAVLGIVKGRYTPLQSRDALAFFDPLLIRKYADYETAGFLGDGEIVWIQCMIRENSSFEVVKNDEVQKYLLLSNSHDGSTGVTIKFTPVRVACHNTLNYALSSGQSTVIKHLPRMQEKLKEKAAQYEQLISAIYEDIEELYKSMAKTGMKTQNIREYFENVFPLIPENRELTDSQKDKNERNRKTIQTLFKMIEENDTLNMHGVRGTLWGSYNAVTELMDHPVNYKKSDKALLKRIWFGNGDLVKRRALGAAREYLVS